MDNKNINNEGLEMSNSEIGTRAINPSIPLVPLEPISYSISTYSVNNSTGSTTTGSTAYCDTNRRIHCNISVTPGAKFKTIKRVLLLLKHKSGATEGFSVHKAYSDSLLDANPFAYVENRKNSSSVITHRVIDITSCIKGSETQNIHIAIKSISGNSLTVSSTDTTLEIDYLEDDDFIPSVSKLERNVGAKGGYSVNARNGKLFYTQNLISAKGERMPLQLSLVYNAADCNTSSPNGFVTGVKGWTFNLGQTLKVSGSNYILLDGAHKYRTFKPSTNNSAIKYDASGKNGAFLTEISEEYTISDGKTMTYKFDEDKRLVEILSMGGVSPVTTTITYLTGGKIATITDGMGDTYTFTYETNVITISKDDTALVKVTLENEKVTEVKYLLSGETYSYDYTTNAELEQIIETSSDEMTVFAYNDAYAVTSIKNYIHKSSTPLPTDCYFMSYALLQTTVDACRNSESKSNKYTSTLYMFAENGETIFACEDGGAGEFNNMRFRTKNDYEKYVGNILDASAINNNDHLAQFTFNTETEESGQTMSNSDIEYLDSDPLIFDTTDFKSKKFIFSAQACVDANSYVTNDGSQSAELYLLKDNNHIATLKFDPQRRDYQVKSIMLELEHGVHNLSAQFRINNMRANIDISNVLIFETNKTIQTERINVFTDAIKGGESDSNGTTWYVNRGGYTLTSGDTQIVGVKFTTKDYLLTTISRFKNPSSFNVWYNDGENMIGGVASAYLIKNGVTQPIQDVRCCSITDEIEKTVFSSTTIEDGMLKTSTVTRIYYQTEDEDGNFYDEFEFFTSSAEYNSYMKLTESKNEDDIVTQYTYNEFGETISEKVFPASTSAMNILTSRTYENGNLASTSEKRYESTYTRMYEYDSDNNLSCEITPNGQYIYHTYTADKEKVAKISATVDGGANENNMTYNGDLVDTLTHNNTVVDFDYDNRNSISNVKIAGVSILSQETLYISNGSKQVIITYGNGAKIKKYYDKYNRLIRVTDVTSTETDICAYLYSDVDITDDTIVDPNAPTLQISSGSKLRAFVDNIAGTRTKYLYDEFGEAKERQVGNVREYINTRDRFNRPTMKVFDDGTERFEKSIHYQNDYSDIISSESTEVSRTSYIRDALNRLTSVKTTQGGNGYTKQFSYIPRGAVPSPEGTTNYINSISYYNVVNNTPTFEKSENIEYNTDGHIVTYGDNTYAYDRIGRLVRENNKSLDKTFLFCYNVGGNIVSKTEYAYTVGEVGTAIKTYNYTYGNAWKDQLTAFDGSAIAYDNSGNPTSYLGKVLTWSKGRLLDQYVSGYTTIANQYDANGIRKNKARINTAPGVIGDIVATSYFYDNSGKLVKESTQGYTRYYFYSSDGIVGYTENGEKLLYRKNLFGDITAIYKGTQKVAEYVYDAWGNCTVTLDTNGYGTRNPIRYRGYYFDSDLGMYYLTTRYYDPKIGRFINADTPKYLQPKSINGLNLYAYCGNNPVMNVDPSGHFLIALGVIAFFAFAAVAIFVAVGTATVIIAEVAGEVGERIGDALEKPVDKFLQKLKRMLNLTPDNVHDMGSGIINDAQNSSEYHSSYDNLGGENIFEAMWEEFNGLE